MLKRFMTWLLRQFQRAIGFLTGRQKSSRTAEQVQPLGAIASRLKPEIIADADSSVALRVQTISPEERQRLQSIDAQRLENSSVVINTAAGTVVNFDLLEPDTHQRLDATPVALPDGLPTSHGFSVEISELISAQSSHLSASQPALKESALDRLSTVDSKSAVDEQLPEIHDLLPAVEPQEADEVQPPESLQQSLPKPVLIESAPISTEPAPVEQVQAESLQIFESEPEAEGEPEEKKEPEEKNEPNENEAEENESEEIVSDQVMLFSFDVIEAEVTHQPSQQDSNKEELAANLPACKSTSFSKEIALKETISKETLLEETDPDAASLETASLETASLETTESSETTNDAFNPWTTATLTYDQTHDQPSPGQLSTKAGVVKLLFKLKPGNFHGYVIPEDGTQDILFHQKYINADIFAQLDRGSRVVAIVKQLEGKAYATRIDLLEEDLLQE